MSVDVLALEEQCRRFRVPFDHFHTLVSAHALLAKMPPDQRLHVQWISNAGWQSVFKTSLVHVGSFEDCVTAVARLFEP